MLIGPTRCSSGNQCSMLAGLPSPVSECEALPLIIFKPRRQDKQVSEAAEPCQAQTCPRSARGWVRPCSSSGWIQTSKQHQQPAVPLCRADTYWKGCYWTYLHSAGALDTQDPSHSKAAALSKRLPCLLHHKSLNFISLTHKQLPSLKRKHQAVFTPPFSTRPGKTQT